MSKYKAVFFDLDHTLWDFDLNSEEAIYELYDSHELASKGISSASDFLSCYRDINKKMWDDYSRNGITKELLRSGRFLKTLDYFGINDTQLADTLSSTYLRSCPVKKNLFPGAIQTLEYLKSKYTLHIITNGFKEVQHLKIKNSGLEPFFSRVHISEEIGYKKPEVEIFHYAVRQAGAVHEQCIMIGDNLDTDIAGADLAGIDTVFFNPLKTKTNAKFKYEISELEQLRNFL